MSVSYVIPGLFDPSNQGIGIHMRGDLGMYVLESLMGPSWDIMKYPGLRS